MAVKTMNIRPRVIAWFTRHPGETVTRDRIAADLDLTEAQVRDAISGWLTKGDGERYLTVVSAGNVWTYNGATPPRPEPVRPKPAQATTVDTKALYEQVGVDGKGAPIVKGEDGRMWRLVPL